MQAKVFESAAMASTLKWVRDNLGPLLNIHLRNGTPLSFLANGQRVPEDRSLANPGQLGQPFLGTGKDEVDHGNGN